MVRKPALIIFFSLFTPFCLLAQTPWKDIPPDSLKDLTEIINHVLHKDSKKDLIERQVSNIQIGIFPAVGYTLQTGFAAVVSTNAVIYHQNKKGTDSSQPSSVSASISYSVKNQVILPVQATLYKHNNKIILLSDWRYLKYPSFTYGLGMNTLPGDSVRLDYQYLKFHQSILFYVGPNIFIGGGINLDYFWDIEEKHHHSGLPTDYDKYGFSPTSFSSGVSLNLLRDTRDNPINAYSGSFENILLMPRFKFMGSDENWMSLKAEYRGYFRFPESSANILALWSYNWLTLSGKPPYLMLPSTGWDKYFSTGRGYIQGRFRSNNMLDQEMEYRFPLTGNGLFGMVVFANFQSFSDINTWRFTAIAPGAGAGLRVKLNKYSRTNIAIDYGVGEQGSKGFFVNLGEFF
jgi:outer membrane protein assembly factor BamA